MRRIIFWQKRPSPHQAPLFAALARRLGAGNVVGVFQEPMEPMRLSLGLSNPDYGNAKVIIGPSEITIEDLIRTDAEHSVHIFSSIPDDPRIYSVYRQCLRHGVTMGVLAEGRDWHDWRRHVRVLKSFFREYEMRSRTDFVLAIGNVGLQWYRHIGYRASSIYPFCYVVETNNLPVIAATRDDRVRIIYIGQLIRRKRVDVLIRALAAIQTTNWDLTLIGSGNESSNIDALVDELKLRPRVKIVGALPNREVYESLVSADLLVLPSRWDGWGAVVNEALHAGVTVVCSDFCGASDVIANEMVGDVFKSGDIEQLAACLERRIASGRRGAGQREQLRNWADCLSGDVVSGYLLSVLNHVAGRCADRPVAPWQSANRSIPDTEPPPRKRYSVSELDAAISSSDTEM